MQGIVWGLPLILNCHLYLLWPVSQSPLQMIQEKPVQYPKASKQADSVTLVWLFSPRERKRGRGRATSFLAWIAWTIHCFCHPKWPSMASRMPTSPWPPATYHWEPQCLILSVLCVTLTISCLNAGLSIPGKNLQGGMRMKDSKGGFYLCHYLSIPHTFWQPLWEGQICAGMSLFTFLCAPC